MQLFLVEIRPLAVLLTSLPFLVHGQSATVNAAIGSAGRPFECPVSIEDCPAVPLPAALSFQSPSEASSTAGPLSHVLHSTLWLVTQTVFRSSKPVKICTKLLLRVLFQFSWILWSIANVLLTPLKRFFNSVVIEPALFVLGLLQSLQPFLLFLLAAVAVGCATGAAIGYFIQTSISYYADYWSGRRQSCLAHTNDSLPSNKPSPPAKIQIYSSQGDLLESEDIEDLELAPSLSSRSTARVGAEKHVSWAPILEHTSRARSVSPVGSPRRRGVNGAFARKRGARK